jgi:hypothetical protein
MILENVRKIRSRINQACTRSSRDPVGVTLIAVTKGRGAGDILKVIEAGVLDIGENKVREALDKRAALEGMTKGLPLRWHMIGHLQTNKVKDAVGIFDLIHSVDSLKLAREIDSRAGDIHKVQDILIEVKTSAEPTKYGIKPDELQGLASDIRGLKNLRLLGLMTLAPAGAAAESARPYFRELAKFGFKELSMGMSGDFEVAVEEGATMVRIGRALFES